MLKIWVGQTTLNGEKKKDGLTTCTYVQKFPIPLVRKLRVEITKEKKQTTKKTAQHNEMPIVNKKIIEYMLLKHFRTN